MICAAAADQAKCDQCALPYLFFQFSCWSAFTQPFHKAPSAIPAPNRCALQSKTLSFLRLTVLRPAEEKALAKCVSADLYFGFGQPADPVKARKCAYAEMDRDAKAPIGGKAILMMVYANGNGATRNFDAAIKLACSIGGAPGR